MSHFMEFNPDVFLFLVFAAYAAGIGGGFVVVGLVSLLVPKANPQRETRIKFLLAAFAPLNTVLLFLSMASPLLALSYFDSTVTAGLTTLAVTAAVGFVLMSIETLTFNNRARNSSLKN